MIKKIESKGCSATSLSQTWLDVTDFCTLFRFATGSDRDSMLYKLKFQCFRPTGCILWASVCMPNATHARVCGPQSSTAWPSLSQTLSLSSSDTSLGDDPIAYNYLDITRGRAPCGRRQVVRQCKWAGRAAANQLNQDGRRIPLEDCLLRHKGEGTSECTMTTCVLTGSSFLTPVLQWRLTSAWNGRVSILNLPPIISYNQ
jgi:hypothetical protein